MRSQPQWRKEKQRQSKRRGRGRRRRRREEKRKRNNSDWQLVLCVTNVRFSRVRASIDLFHCTSIQFAWHFASSHLKVVHFYNLFTFIRAPWYIFLFSILFSSLGVCETVHFYQSYQCANRCFSFFLLVQPPLSRLVWEEESKGLQNERKSALLAQSLQHTHTHRLNHAREKKKERVDVRDDETKAHQQEKSPSLFPPSLECTSQVEWSAWVEVRVWRRAFPWANS